MKEKDLRHLKSNINEKMEELLEVAEGKNEPHLNNVVWSLERLMTKVNILILENITDDK